VNASPDWTQKTRGRGKGVSETGHHEGARRVQLALKRLFREGKRNWDTRPGGLRKKKILGIRRGERKPPEKPRGCLRKRAREQRDTLNEEWEEKSRNRVLPVTREKGPPTK